MALPLFFSFAARSDLVTFCQVWPSQAGFGLPRARSGWVTARSSRTWPAAARSSRAAKKKWLEAATDVEGAMSLAGMGHLMGNDAQRRGWVVRWRT